MQTAGLTGYAQRGRFFRNSCEEPHPPSSSISQTWMTAHQEESMSKSRRLSWRKYKLRGMREVDPYCTSARGAEGLSA